jgi:GGDEF domain-containing protein
MSDEGRSMPGLRTILAGLLVAVAAFLLQALILAVLPSDRVTAALTIMACSLLLAVAVLTALRGLARLCGHIRDLHHRLAQALTDPVTGLPVRRVAEDAIAATGPDIALTVALADVDRLHKINHGPGGHAVGDRHLAEAGLRLRHAATDGDSLTLGSADRAAITVIHGCSASRCADAARRNSGLHASKKSVSRRLPEPASIAGPTTESVVPGGTVHRTTTACRAALSFSDRPTS